MANLTSMFIGQKWEVRVSDEDIQLPGWIAEAGKRALSRWQHVFPKERSWIQNEFGIPSFIVRVEGVPVGDRFHFFEIEERPAGVGITAMHSQPFAENLGKLTKIWPAFKVLVSDARQGAGDDYLWREIVTPEKVQDSDLLIIRAEPEETEFHRFMNRSVSSLVEKGNKIYGEKFGWWKTVSDESELPWGSPFVIKPCQGSKARGLEIWDPIKKRQGCSTKSRIIRTLSKAGKMYCQPLADPIAHEDGMMFYRIFYGFDPCFGEWVCLGGCYNVRPNLRIHGASDAFFGALVY
ncbi:MAG: hypothetical protein WA087_04370 [Candidatus Saccharimonadales bacterium]